MSTADGQTAVTPTPYAAASERSASERPTTACLVMTYDVSSPAAISPPIEAVLTMWPLPWRDHHRVRRVHAVDDAADVDVDDRVPVVERELLVSPPMLMPALLNIRSSAPCAGGHVRDQRRDGGRVGDVQRDRPRRARPGHRRDRRRGGVEVEVRADDVGAGGDQRPRQRRPDPGAGAGDDRGATGEPRRPDLRRPTPPSSRRPRRPGAPPGRRRSPRAGSAGRSSSARGCAPTSRRCGRR